ncbi:arylesterase [Candidatus Kaiserbacteria bacterium]|nr:arylesterase [Candidatus Kaiserbacteria bacterium]USN92392.1 MAG: arylesterase [Candidatus Nomurabacteria bacterium]
MSKQKRILVVFVIVVGLYFLLSSFWQKQEPLYPANGTSIVVFGDSLAYGVGATANNDIASRLETKLNTPVINSGVSGNTTADALNRIDELLKLDPKVVIVILGGNDALRRLPIKDTFNNLEKIIVSLTDYGSAVVLVGEPGGLYGQQYEKEYERLAEEHRTFYVSNILSGLLGRPEYMSDLIHPNDSGYEMATERILPVIEEIIAKTKQ